MTLTADPLDSLLRAAVRDRIHPGAVWAVGDAGATLTEGAAGAGMGPDTAFELAGLGQVLDVWPAVGTLVGDGDLQLHTPLGAYLGELSGRPLAGVTSHHLLTHTAGLRDSAAGPPVPLLHTALHRAPSETVEYSDRAARILGHLVERLSGRPADRLAAERVWQPLGMTRTGPRRTAPGADGPPGIRSVLGDLTRFLRHLLGPDPVPFGAAWVRESLRIRTGELAPPRGLFWRPAAGTHRRQDIWVHHGPAGSGLWLSPAQSRWAVLLTGRGDGPRDRAAAARVRETFRAAAFR
ncbi:beta-lactamase family protein [Streptomyces bambusae]|uniref:serine hydrolase domain-containing protein n=1 Tax=Streptomyces bambusae TaxID=1550616 RepID=UPI001CFDB217|nr:serine hydrolase domain-containing protein [Streptomyces bambusae]MCB5164106.1 beta-lactamase family protein [Streptomyces bambusae]